MSMLEYENVRPVGVGEDVVCGERADREKRRDREKRLLTEETEKEEGHEERQ